MEIDELLKEVDFTDDNAIEISGVINEMLQDIESDDNGIDVIEKIFIFERLLIIAQSQLVPFIERLVSFECFKEFKELEDSVQYVLRCWKESRIRPYPDIQYYIDLSYNMTMITDDDYEAIFAADESIEDIYPKHEIMHIRDEWHSEIEQKGIKTKILVEFAYEILEVQCYFLEYFLDDNINEKRIIDLCETQIDIILFDILWNIDTMFGNKMEKSYFGKAVKDILLGLKLHQY